MTTIAHVNQNDSIVEEEKKETAIDLYQHKSRQVIPIVPPNEQKTVVQSSQVKPNDSI